jgi:hypothetical protein
MLPAPFLDGQLTNEVGELQALAVRNAEMLEAPVAFNCAAQGFGLDVGDMGATTAQLVTESPLPTDTFSSPVTLKLKLSAPAQTPSSVAATRSVACAPFLVVKIMMFPCS